MQLTPEQANALRAVVRAKLQLWDQSSKAEAVLGQDIDTESHAFGALCVVSDLETVDEIPEEDLIEAFELEDSAEC